MGTLVRTCDGFSDRTFDVFAGMHGKLIVPAIAKSLDGVQQALIALLN